MKRETINIPKPKGNQGEKVMVKNYRRKNIWQKGIITSLEYRNSWGNFSWSYDVVVEGRKGQRVRIYVADDGIMSLKEYDTLVATGEEVEE